MRRVQSHRLPHFFVKAGEILAVVPKRAMVIEKGISAFRAVEQGGFGLVIGVPTADNTEELKAQGANMVVIQQVEFPP
jgi:alpha,alpha-trehalose phosphorylase